MTATDRRHLLATMVATPLVLTGAAHASNAEGLEALENMDTLELLEFGAADADREFAALCAAAAAAQRQYEVLADRKDQAEEAASEETPPFPEGLWYKRHWSPNEGEPPRLVDERLLPTGPNDGMLWNLAHRRVRDLNTGETVPQAQAALWAEFSAWRAMRDAARERAQISALEADVDAAVDYAHEVLAAVLGHPARSGRALACKLYLFALAGETDHEAILADARRVLCATGGK